ncbi:unnamed protein product [Somion occarium]|uniref:F-box domain-containing protein n=1 Tax=Somion occarium TaxID=3059160 RepID=A0ABP1DHQ9_9APHY
MPPRRKKVKQDNPRPNLDATPSNVPNLEKSRPAATSVSKLGTGLSALPVELRDMIFEEVFQSLRDVTREDVLRNSRSLPTSYAEKRDMLRSLSQTCRSLRPQFIPLLWENVEACVTRKENGTWYKELGEKLENLSDGLVKSPELAQHVRTLSVSLTKYQTNSVLPEFAHCLKHLPHLHTLQIMHANSQITTPLKNAFQGNTYPQIRTIALPDCAHNILRSCPDVIEVICNEGDGGKLVTSIGAACKKVEVVQDIWPQDGIAKRPNWRDVSPEEIRNLSAFNNLAVLSITVGADDADSSGLAATRQEHIEAARETLKKTKFAGPKRLLVNYNSHDRVNDFSLGHWKIVRTETFNM